MDFNGGSLVFSDIMREIICIQKHSKTIIMIWYAFLFGSYIFIIPSFWLQIWFFSLFYLEQKWKVTMEIHPDNMKIVN